MVVFNVIAISNAAVVSCSSAPSTVPHRINAQASTIANRPKSSAVSTARAINRSPKLAKRYSPLLPVRAETDLGCAAGAGSTTPDSSSRCWPVGIPSPQRSHCLAYGLSWLSQFGHRIVVKAVRTQILSLSSISRCWLTSLITEGQHLVDSGQPGCPEYKRMNNPTLCSEGALPSLCAQFHIPGVP